MPAPRRFRFPIHAFCALIALSLVVSNFSEAQSAPLPPGSWRFIVSGDSRNCGDIVMPAIAANAAKFSPVFYWHLGDLRAIYKIDEDMAFAAKLSGQTLTCKTYGRRAWSDFIDNQIAPFNELPFYVGIGNHEVMPPKNGDAFQRQFSEWLDIPTLHLQRYSDGEPDRAEPYYHWIQGGVDFIYLDNSYSFFSEDQLTWLFRRLSDAQYSSNIKALVVGMHEALPDSLANKHSMGDADDPRGRATGEIAYNALKAFHEKYKKPVFVLASHSHFYMGGIFHSPALSKKEGEPLPGWIIGGGGAVRYPLPTDPPPPPGAKTDIYGYLLGTVDSKGNIEFSLQEVHEGDIPAYVNQRYGNEGIRWCFDHNSLNKEPNAKDITLLCPTE